MSVNTPNIYDSVFVSHGIEQFKNIDATRLSDTVIIVCDNDGKAIDENIAIQRAFAALIAEGKQVYALIPDLLQHMSKTDFNDILQKRGIEGIKEALINVQPIIQRMDKNSQFALSDPIEKQNKSFNETLNSKAHTDARHDSKLQEISLQNQHKLSSSVSDLFAEYEKMQATQAAVKYDKDMNNAPELTIEKEI